MQRWLVLAIFTIPLGHACAEPSRVVHEPDCDALGVLGFEYTDDGIRINRCIGPGPYQVLSPPDALDECDLLDPHTLTEACGYNDRGERTLSCERWQWQDGAWVPCPSGDMGCPARRFGLVCSDDDPLTVSADRDQCRLGDLRPIVRHSDATLSYDRVELYECLDVGDIADWRPIGTPTGWFETVAPDDDVLSPFDCAPRTIDDLRADVEERLGTPRVLCYADGDCQGFGEASVCLAGRCSMVTPPPPCVAGTARAVAVDPNGRGVSWQLCDGDGFASDLVCRAHLHPERGTQPIDDCLDATYRVEPCGQGWRYDICVRGDWRLGPCLPDCPDAGPCVAGVCHHLIVAGPSARPIERAVCVLPACDNGLLDPGEISADVGGRCPARTPPPVAATPALDPEAR